MISVTKTYLPDKEKYKKYVDKIFECGWLTNNGRFVQELEKRLEEYLGLKHIILVSNGTLALQVAYKALDLKGEVITTPFSFVATTSTLVWEGLKPKFVDIDKDTFNIDCNKIKAAITENTSAIVPVHVFANGCDVEAIDNIAKEYNLKVIYDAAHAFDVKYKGESILNYGDISTLSFHSTKVFHTIEGGAIIVNDDKLYEKIKLMINFGISGPSKIQVLGINSKMNEFQAAMGLCVLDDIHKTSMNRKKVYNRYVEAFGQNRKIRMQKHNEKCSYNYGYFPIVFDSEEKLLKVKKKLESESIYPRRYFYPSLDTLSYIQDKGNSLNSQYIACRILCLPLYESLSNDSQENIIRIIKDELIV